MRVWAKRIGIYAVVLYGLAIIAVALQPKHPVAQPRPSVYVLGTSDVDLNTLFTLVNQDRTDKGLPALKLNPDLQASASDKCGDMVKHGYYDHISPAGVSWISFIERHTAFKLASENLDSRTVEATAAEVNSDWMNSPEHRANILDGRFTNVGYASCMGQINGQPAIDIVQHFAQL